MVVDKTCFLRKKEKGVTKKLKRDLRQRLKIILSVFERNVSVFAVFFLVFFWVFFCLYLDDFLIMKEHKWRMLLARSLSLLISKVVTV